jgi:hypothetical protein
MDLQIFRGFPQRFWASARQGVLPGDLLVIPSIPSLTVGAFLANGGLLL